MLILFRDMRLDIVGFLETDLHVSAKLPHANGRLSATQRTAFGHRDLYDNATGSGS